MSVRDLLGLVDSTTDRRPAVPPPKPTGASESRYRDALRKTLEPESPRRPAESPKENREPAARTNSTGEPATSPPSSRTHSTDETSRPERNPDAEPAPKAAGDGREATEEAEVVDVLPFASEDVDQQSSATDADDPPILQLFAPPTNDPDATDDANGANGENAEAEGSAGAPIGPPGDVVQIADAGAPDDAVATTQGTEPNVATSGEEERPPAAEGRPPQGLPLFPNAARKDAQAKADAPAEPAADYFTSKTTNVGIAPAQEDGKPVTNADAPPKPPAGLFADSTDPVTPTVVMAAADPKAKWPDATTVTDTVPVSDGQPAPQSVDAAVVPIDVGGDPRTPLPDFLRHPSVNATMVDVEPVASVQSVASKAASTEEALSAPPEAAPVSTTRTGEGRNSTAPVVGTTADPAAAERAIENAERIVQGIRLASSSGRALRVRLDPPELGTVRIEVAMQDGAVVARLEVETASARSTILDRIATLQDQLAQQGHPVDRVEVQVSEPAGRHAATDDERTDERLPQHERERDQPGDGEEAADEDDAGVMDEIDLEV